MKAAMILAALLALAGCADRDDSDPPDGRSGFTVFTDNLNGCQYIGWAPSPLLFVFGAAITPRLGRDGRQVCRVPAEGGAQ